MAVKLLALICGCVLALICGCVEEPCESTWNFVGEFIGPELLDAGRYSLELRAPADFRGRVTVTIKH